MNSAEKLTAAAHAALYVTCKTIGRFLPANDNEAFYDGLTDLLVEEYRCTKGAANRAINLAIVRLTYASK